MIGNSKRFFFLSICGLIVIICVFLCYNIHIDFSQVANGHLIQSKPGEYVYYEIINESDVTEIYNISDDLPNYDFDFINHSYIISFGYEITDLSYSRLSKPIFHDYDFYVPKVYLKNKKTDYCYIYEIQKLNIDVDPDNYKRNVFFVD